MQDKYELDWTRVIPESNVATMFAILTGLPDEEIIAALPKHHINGMRGQEFISSARNMGFNVNPRWKKFDKNTETPCILRMKSSQEPKDSRWWIAVYYNNWVDEGNTRWRFDQYFKIYRQLRITSMLQVWI